MLFKHRLMWDMRQEPQSPQNETKVTALRLAAGHDSAMAKGIRAVPPMTPTTDTPTPRGLLRFVLHLPVYVYRARLDVLLGHRFLLLVHRGHRSGRRYETVLEVLHYNPVTDESI